MAPGIILYTDRICSSHDPIMRDNTWHMLLRACDDALTIKNATCGQYSMKPCSRFFDERANVSAEWFGRSMRKRHGQGGACYVEQVSTLDLFNITRWWQRWSAGNEASKQGQKVINVTSQLHWQQLKSSGQAKSNRNQYVKSLLCKNLIAGAHDLPVLE